MARIRSVKPEFWTDPDIVAMAMEARLFFIGCWNHADDYGVMKDDPARLRLQIMPADTDLDAASIIDELVERRHLLRMTAPDGTEVLVVRSFTVHQKIDKRAVGRWGHPDDFDPRVTPDPPAARPVPTDPAPSPPLPTDPHPGLEGKGLEGTGPSNTPSTGTSLALVGAQDPLPAAPAMNYPDTFAAWWERYPRKVGKQAALAAYNKARRKAGGHYRLFSSLEDHNAAWKANGTDDQFIPHPATWLNEGRYDDPPPAITGPRAPSGSKSAENMARIQRSAARAAGATS